MPGQSKSGDLSRKYEGRPSLSKMSSCVKAGTWAAWFIVIDPSTARTSEECHGVKLRPSCGIKAMDSLLISVDGWIDSLICSERF